VVGTKGVRINLNFRKLLNINKGRIQQQEREPLNTANSTCLALTGRVVELPESVDTCTENYKRSGMIP
jgi:hypothetical protein